MPYLSRLRHEDVSATHRLNPTFGLRLFQLVIQWQEIRLSALGLGQSRGFTYLSFIFFLRVLVPTDLATLVKFLVVLMGT